MANIKPHFFHGVYSNNGYYPDFPDITSSVDILYADKPLHVNRAILGAKDPFNGSSQISKFKTEEEAVTWYKKSKFGETLYNKIKSSESGGFCKNYFKINETDFFKFRQYFNGMIKSVIIKSNVYMSADGSWTVKEDTEECSYNTSLFSVLDIEPLGLDTALEEGLTILDDKSAIFEGQSTAVGTGTGRSGTWYSYQNFYIESNSELILTDDNLGKRIGAKYLSREFIIEEKDYETGEVKPHDNLKIINENDNFIYEKQWEFNDNNFKKIFTDSDKKFSRDSTLINDPLIVVGADYLRPKNINFQNLIVAGGEGLKTHPFCISSNIIGTNDSRTFDVDLKDILGKSYDQTSNNLGIYSISIQNSEFVESTGYAWYDASLVGTVVVYIESLKTYLCFFELNIQVNTRVFAYQEKDGEPNGQASPAALGGPGSPNLFTTDDEVSAQKKPVSDIEIRSGDYFPVEKVFIEIKVCEQPVQIEVWKMSQKSFTWSESKDKIETPWGTVDIPGSNKCFEGSFTMAYTFEQPYIEIKGWDKADFNKNVVYPPKLK